MIEVESGIVNTNMIAIHLAKILDISYSEILEVLLEEEKYLKELVKTGNTVVLSNMVVFEPYITKFHNLDCKTRLSRMFREYLRTE